MLVIHQQRNQMHSFPAVTEVTVEQSRQTIKQAITLRVVSARTGEVQDAVRVPSRGTIPHLKGQGRFLRGCDLQEEQEVVKTQERKRVFEVEGQHTADSGSCKG